MQRPVIPYALTLVCLMLAAAIAVAEHMRWRQLELVDASGVPREPEHTYRFKGVIEITRHQTEKGLWSAPDGLSRKGATPFVGSFQAEGSGRWDGRHNEAQEAFRFEGDVQGQLAATLRCLRDPWLYATSCVVDRVQFASPQATLLDWEAMYRQRRRPFTAEKVTLAHATKLSKRHATTAPPSPSAPQARQQQVPPLQAASPTQVQRQAPHLGNAAQATPSSGPMYAGYRIDWCLRWEQDCGAPAAHTWCRAQGFKGASGWVRADDIGQFGPTYVLQDVRLCTAPTCDGFASIVCTEPEAAGPAGELLPAATRLAVRQQAFDAPHYAGYRLDYCLRRGQDCGAAAAHAWCRAQGFGRAVIWERAANVGTTYVLEDRKVCEGTCDSFRRVTCVP